MFIGNLISMIGGQKNKVINLSNEAPDQKNIKMISMFQDKYKHIRKKKKYFNRNRFTGKADVIEKP